MSPGAESATPVGFKNDFAPSSGQDLHRYRDTVQLYPQSAARPRPSRVRRVERVEILEWRSDGITESVHGGRKIKNSTRARIRPHKR